MIKRKTIIKTATLSLVLSLGIVTAQNNTYPYPATGSVGIGTTTPKGKFHVNGEQYISDPIYPMLKMSADNTNAIYDAGIHFDGYSAAPTYEVRFGRYTKAGLWQANPFNFSIEAPNFSFVMKKDGKCGIGTSSPKGKLHVNGEQYISDPIYPMLKMSADNTNAIYDAGIHFDGYGTSPTYQVRFGRYTKAGLWQANPFNFSLEAPNFSFVMTKEGKVTIGLPDYWSKTNEPNCKLFVAGGILTEKVKVATYANWADYVFANEYELKSLKEVENFIHKNKHLPNIPSAKEVKEQGLDLGEMQAKQMEKIEELTLYIIQMNKEMIVLKNEISALKK
jgi:hypothetical protein